MADVGEEMQIAPSVSKSYAAQVVHRAVEAASPVGAEELEATLTVKMSRVGPDLLPYEGMSFPAFRHLELADEEWQDSDLLSRIEQMLIVPVHGATRTTPQGDCVVGHPLLWKPTAEQLAVIEGEWTTFRCNGSIRATCRRSR